MPLCFSFINVVSWVLGVVFGLVVLLFLVGFIAFLGLTVRRNPLPSGNCKPFLMGPNEDKFNVFLNTNIPLFNALSAENISVTSVDGLKLLGLFFECPEKTDKTVICVHGYGSKPAADYCSIAPLYLKNGYNVLCPINRGHGKSEGNYIGFGALDGYDMRLWTDWVNTRYPNGLIFLHGISMGAATVLTASNKNLKPAPNVVGVVADCSFTSAYDVVSYQIKRVLHISGKPILAVADMFCHALAGYNFNKRTPLDAVKEMELPVLFIHGKSDKFIPVQQNDLLFNACTSADKQRILFDDTGHAGSFCMHDKEYNEAVLAFFDRLTKARANCAA